MGIGLNLLNVGSAADQGDGDSARAGGIKINTNFVDIYSQYGSVPIILDPSDPKYGTLKTFDATENIEADLHPAGYWQKTMAKNPGEIRSDGSNANVFYASRGEQIIIDFSQLDVNDSFNFVLPLARKGDVVQVRDSYNTLDNGKKLLVFATPYNYVGTTPWEWGEIVNGEPASFPSVNAVNIDGISRSFTTITDWPTPLPNDLSHTSTVLKPDTAQQLFFTTTVINIEFVYGGDDIGWNYYLTSKFDPSLETIGKTVYETPAFSAANQIQNTSAKERIIFNPYWLFLDNNRFLFIAIIVV